MASEQNYIFISYAHKDKKIISKAVDALKSQGIQLWYDKGIKAGADWSENIGSKLKQASLMLLFLSKSSIKSDNVRREIEFADTNKIPILTVQIANPKLNAELSKKLAVNQFINLKSQKTYGTFAETVKKYTVDLNCINEAEAGEYKDKKIKIKTGIVWKIILAVIVLAIALDIAVNKLLYADAPIVIGMLSSPAEERMSNAGFDCAVGLDYTTDEDIGYIYDQNHKGKTYKNNQVVLTESLGPDEDLTEVPALIGYHITEAVSKLVDANMTSFIISPVTSSEYQIAYVADQSISAGYRVSCHNKIELSVSSEPGTVIEIFNQQITLDDKKIQLDIDDEGGVKITPLMVMAVDVDYTETDPISTSRDIDATMNVKINVSREDTEAFGTFRGSFEFNCLLEGDSSIMWKAIEAVLSENGQVGLLAKSDVFSFKLEPWDEDKFSDFVKTATHSKEQGRNYKNPIAMALVTEIPITEMNKGMRSVSKLMRYANMFSVGLPKVEDNILYQNYSIVIQENGEAWVTLYNSKGGQRIMSFHGNISYEDLIVQ